jgi:hypothetical protein
MPNNNQNPRVHSGSIKPLFVSEDLINKTCVPVNDRRLKAGGL